MLALIAACATSVPTSAPLTTPVPLASFRSSQPEGSATASTPSPSAPAGWHLAATERSSIDHAYSVSVATSPTQWRQLWSNYSFTDGLRTSRFADYIVAAFAHGAGSSCPDLVLRDVVINLDKQLVYSDATIAPTPQDPSGNRPCTADLASAVVFLVELDRNRLPTSPFVVDLVDPNACSGRLCTSQRVNLAIPTPGPS